MDKGSKGTVLLLPLAAIRAVGNKLARCSIFGFIDMLCSKTVKKLHEIAKVIPKDDRFIFQLLLIYNYEKENYLYS